MTEQSLLEPSSRSNPELDALFDQSPIAMVFLDRELRARRANAAFRRLIGLPDEEIIGRRPSEADGLSIRYWATTRPIHWRTSDGTAWDERTVAEQVIGRGVPVVNMHVEWTRAGKRQVLSWSGYRVTENGRVLGALLCFIDFTDHAQTITQAHARLDLLERAGSQVGATLDIHHTARELADLAVPELADRISVDLLDQVLQGETLPRAGSGALRFRRVALRDTVTSTKIRYEVDDLITLPVTSPHAVALLQGRPFLARNPAEVGGQFSDTPDVAEAFFARGVHTIMVMPLVARGVTLGVASFSRAEHPEPYGEADVRLVGDLASRAAVCIDNARLYTREHNMAVTLQRSLLPQRIPQMPGLRIAHRYEPATQTAEVGGDWFDVIPLDTGQVALVIGDVTGHGIHAAALMGQLRTTTAALARLGCPPEEIMRRLSDVVAEHDDEIGATCLYALYDPESRRCRFTSAGHLPPALRHPGGSVEFIDVPGGMMLGVGPSRYPATDTELPEDGVLALYTDGLVEHPGQDIGTGMSDLARTLTAGSARSLDRLCDSVLADLGADARDDIALLLARTTAGTAR
ncbi:PP2C family protein-serine/threonine phosphatase [Actinoallomurus iriomotensis]|uniref:protein-serine/threonine phosphatase n=1 Tax=Actinoallomurus iriomotensis TaxID=478107 RepID=A0A9W6RPT7_9ACTN|nr:GAF domain-containing SpoIIE family protein phosphatase [Actinoallomurus iriomotensis]GLY79573.1 membrane protein [Actinoallomurus iriomotensis]